MLAAVEYLSHALHHLRARRPSGSSSSSAGSSPLLALSTLISETRYTLRLLGLVPLWTWGSATLRSPPRDRIIYAATLLQVLLNMAYQFLENGAFLASKGVITTALAFPSQGVRRDRRIAKWYLWSTRAWLGHVVLQFVVLWRWRVLRLRQAGNKETAAAKETDSPAEDAGPDDHAWRKSLVSNLVWAPLCVHWSVEQGVGIPGGSTGLLSFLAGAWDLSDVWRATLDQP